MSWEGVGVDVGGSKIDAARVRGGRIEEVVRLPVPAGGPGAVVAAVAEAAARVRRPGLPVGVGVAGQVDGAGSVLGAPNLPLAGVALAGELRRRLDCPVAVDNDVRMAALGEWWLLDPKPGVLAALTVGTGVGSGVVLDGVSLRGAHGLAGEGGHITAVHGGEQCACGRRGCVEAYAGGRSLARRYRALAGDGAPVTAADVVALARRGDATAVRVWKDAVAALEVLVRALVLLFDPDVLSLGGGLAEAVPELRHALQLEVQSSAAWPTVQPPALVEMHRGAALVGAARLGWKAAGGATP